MDMQQRFKQRGYKSQTLTLAYNIALSLERVKLLSPESKQEQTHKPHFVTQYSREALQIKHIIKKNWDIIESDHSLLEIFTKPPRIIFRRAPTIKDKLVGSYLPAPKLDIWLRRPKGNFCCGNCNYFENVVKTDTFRDVFSNKTYSIASFINFNTTYVVYLLECTCGCFCVDFTKRRLRDKVAEHRYAIRSGNTNYPMAKHYKEAKHGSDATLNFNLISNSNSNSKSNFCTSCFVFVLPVLYLFGVAPTGQCKPCRSYFCSPAYTYSDCNLDYCPRVTAP